MQSQQRKSFQSPSEWFDGTVSVKLWDQTQWNKLDNCDMFLGVTILEYFKVLERNISDKSPPRNIIPISNRFQMVPINFAASFHWDKGAK